MKLKAKSGKEFPLSVAACGKSKLLSQIISDFDLAAPIDVSDFEDELVQFVVEYLEETRTLELKELPKPVPGSLFMGMLTDYEKKIVATDDVEWIKSVMEIANFFDIQLLLDLFAAKLSLLLKNLSIKEIRELLGEENDFTEEELAELEEFIPKNVE